ncbi:MAG: hypothetical protein A3D56_00130 [Candidatus Taylorbacteria bacterium RIFCSPHIGHO2_02_FULL_45_35]|uniref:Uncharacterized protein n=1 Tax=Candidatus Taylorbacteria bacterium RIFCSPHIGHO2_02_FULL_45_35 TaxID=1802311 RepID=A0A1G2MYI1_9BACT|nr:MAG: hypothetical protein A3D56_00130 [Candidatus Taylorbacteria bacterium RIFCSPHIGHO2_02_FULL_45_35]OHA34897.1 MAG: hypothetical protein A3A22_02925 [Candidatus Taylorbacteria bacterium RIFCSPLOWO2_01_FULL_45_34b]
MKRVFANLFLFLSVLVFPWYVTVSALVIFIFLFRNFYEAAFFSFLLDVVYSTPGTYFLGVPFILTLASFVFLILASFLKRHLLLRA